MTTARRGPVGPILFARGANAEASRLSAVVLLGADEPPPVVRAQGSGEIAGVRIYQQFGWAAWRYDFVLPASPAARYAVGDKRFAVNTQYGGDFRGAFVSCNGQEDEEEGWEGIPRNTMWDRLKGDHDRAPLNLLMHGGDQIYADAMLDAHSRLRRWRVREVRPYNDEALAPEMRQAAEAFLFKQYLRLYSAPSTAYLLARVPSLMIWDDHDIMDGWGSFEDWRLETPVGLGLFAVAKRLCLLFQLGASVEHPAQNCLDRQAQILTHVTHFPGFSVIAPDLRSERTHDRVLGDRGWTALDAALDRTKAAERVLFMTSVPLLGPKIRLAQRLSALMPGLGHLADELVDQWQSGAHVEQWHKVLYRLTTDVVSNQHALTILTGEMHAASRAELRFQGNTIHQCMASGIAHPPPTWSEEFGLNTFARLGAQKWPKGGRIRLMRIPGKRRRYVPERNYLVVGNKAARWQVSWEFEKSGASPPLWLG